MEKQERIREELILDITIMEKHCKYLINKLKNINLKKEKIQDSLKIEDLKIIIEIHKYIDYIVGD